MNTQALRIAGQQAETLAARVAAHNAAFQAMVDYFGAICDGHDLPRTTAFVSVDASTNMLVVQVPTDPEAPADG